MRRVLSTLLALTTVLGCGGADSTQTPARTAQAASAERRGRTVTVTRDLTFRSESGASVTMPDPDAAALTVDLLVPLADGSFEVRTAPSSATATWRFEEVPHGEYLVRVTLPMFGVPSVFAARGNELDLGWEEIGRPGRQPALSGVPLALGIQGAAPVVEEDLFQLYSPDANNGDFAAVDPGMFPPGETAGVLAYDWFFSLLGPGDVLRVSQYRAVPVDGDGVMRTSVAAGAVTGLEMVDGSASLASVVLSPVVDTGTLAVDWRFQAFEDALTPAQATGPVVHNLVVDAMPGDPGSASSSMNLLDVDVAGGRGDRDLGPLGYGRFLPETYRELCIVRAAQTVQRLAPGATTPARPSAIVRRESPAEDGCSGPILPVVGPPRRPTIAGRDALAPQAGVGTSPVIAWSAPELGEPTSYFVWLFQLRTVWGRTVRVSAALLYTDHKQIQLPPELLEPGSSYIVTIDSRWSATAVENAPLRFRRPVASGSTVTEVFSP